MSTLLIRLAGPMQSWGTQSRFSVRDTGLEPSKSGVIGLLCAALGKPREERPGGSWPTLKQLTDLKMGVRVDRQGAVKHDYHTALNVAKAGGGKPKSCELSTRDYLADAEFIVGLESPDDGLLRSLDNALQHPVWPLYLGRKSFVPSMPVHIPGCLSDNPLRDTLANYHWLARTPREQKQILAVIDAGEQKGKPYYLRIVFDAEFGTTSEVRCDVPISFAERRFTIRHIQTDWAELTPDMIQEETPCTSPA